MVTTGIGQGTDVCSHLTYDTIGNQRFSRAILPADRSLYGFAAPSTAQPSSCPLSLSIPTTTAELTGKAKEEPKVRAEPTLIELHERFQQAFASAMQGQLLPPEALEGAAASTSRSNHSLASRGLRVCLVYWLADPVFRSDVLDAYRRPNQPARIRASYSNRCPSVNLLTDNNLLSASGKLACLW